MFTDSNSSHSFVDYEFTMADILRQFMIKYVKASLPYFVLHIRLLIYFKIIILLHLYLLFIYYTCTI